MRMVSGHSQPHTEKVLTVPEMQNQYISCEVGVVLLSEVGEGISLPEGTVSRCREALRGAGFTYKLQTPRCILMPGQTPGGRWFLKWQNLYTRCDGELAALPDNFCFEGDGHCPLSLEALMFQQELCCLMCLLRLRCPFHKTPMAGV